VLKGVKLSLQASGAFSKVPVMSIFCNFFMYLYSGAGRNVMGEKRYPGFSSEIINLSFLSPPLHKFSLIDQQLYLDVRSSPSITSEPFSKFATYSSACKLSRLLFSL
jgi:hypothetical protein